MLNGLYILKNEEFYKCRTYIDLDMSLIQVNTLFIRMWFKV